MKAHDVRHLRFCIKCQSLGDGRKMIEISSQLFHDVCAYRHLGVAGVLNLPIEQRMKFSIGSVGKVVMKKMLDKADRERAAAKKGR
jgi:hypothetical protein